MTWNPWRALRDDPTVEFQIRPLPALLGGALYWPLEGWSLILIDKGAGQVERNALLAHELVHHERQGGAARQGMPESWRDVVTRDESIVDDEVARRLVPQAELVEFIAARCTMEGGGTAFDVAEEFNVPEPVAQRRLEMLEREWSGP